MYKHAVIRNSIDKVRSGNANEVGTAVEINPQRIERLKDFLAAVARCQASVKDILTPRCWKKMKPFTVREVFRLKWDLNRTTKIIAKDL